MYWIFLEYDQLNWFDCVFLNGIKFWLKDKSKYNDSVLPSIEKINAFINFI